MQSKNLQELYQDIDIQALEDFTIEGDNTILLTRQKQELALQKFSSAINIDDIKLQEITPKKEQEINNIEDNTQENEQGLNIDFNTEKNALTNETGKETWISIEEFVKISGFDLDKVQDLVKEGLVKNKTINNRAYIDISTGTLAIIKKIENNIKATQQNSLSPIFVEKTIATILSLHDKVINAKDETISAVKSENSFLKDTVISMQEVYDDNKKTIDYLKEELRKKEEEGEFMKRKYRLMWGKVSNSTN